MTVVPFPKPSTPRRVFDRVLAENPLYVIVLYLDADGAWKVQACENLSEASDIQAVAKALTHITKVATYGKDETPDR